MKMTSLALAALFGLPGIANAQEKTQEKAQEKKPAIIKVIVPEKGFDNKDTAVTIEGKVTETTGKERMFMTPPLESGKTYLYKIEALIEPNNYTKITRTKEIEFKAGETVTVDLTKKDDKTDKIVVRWVPTPDDIVDKMCEMAKVGKDDVVYDPGCGDAVMLIRPIKLFGAKRGIGIDIDPEMIEKAKVKAKAEGVADKVIVRLGDILNEKDMEDVKEASVVLVYIGDDLGARMSPVLQKVLKPGTRIVSHRFSLGDWKPDKTETVKGADGDEYVLHYWVVKAKEKEKK
jgi:uncharacterized protein (TIGR03000 family)